MVKKKGGRDMNPADAFRKVQRQKEIQRNKRERQFQRDASKLKSDPDQIKTQLGEVLDLQDEGKNNMTIKLKKKALQGALDASIRKKKEDAVRAHYGDALPAIPGEHGHGIPQQSPEDSVYYHPTLNPTGMPPPGKPQRYRTTMAEPASAAPAVPLPKPPPLPAGPAPPNGPAPPWAQQPPADGSAQPPLPPPPGAPAGAAPLPPPPFPSGGPLTVLPPPDGPPPEPPLLPPPDEPPPGLAAMGRLAPPPGPPPGMVLLPPPGMPPPGMLPPPTMPPPGFGMPGGEEGAQSREHKGASISGQATVAPRLPAAKDRSLTSMVPASVRVKRDAGQQRAGQGLIPARNAAPPMGAGFGLAPEPAARRQEAAAAGRSSAAARPGAAGLAARKPAPRPEDDKFMQFMADMQQLGAIS